MRIYVFKSDTTDRLRAFAGDPDVNKLPRQHGPWTATGTISPDNAPPYNFSRDAIEKAINAEGFQLWRLREKTWSTEQTQRFVRSASLPPIAADAFSHQGRGETPLAAENGPRPVGLPGRIFLPRGAAIRPSRWAFLRASFRARRIASACSRFDFSDGFS